MAKTQIVKSRAALDAEERSKKDYESPFLRPSTKGPEEESELNQHGYVGVDPIYQNAANATDKPAAALEDDEDDEESEGSSTAGRAKAAAEKAAAEKAAAEKAAG